MGFLDGKVAVITGAGSGMGKASVEVFVREGARVVAGDISGAEKATAAEVGGGVLPVHCDVTKEADVEAMVAAALEQFGRVDAVLNVAGIADGCMLGDVTANLYDRIMDVDLRGVMFGMKHGIRAMLKGGGGSIVNWSSIGGLNGALGTSVYSAAKAGVIAVTKVGAVEYGAQGIRVNVICPGFIDTPLFRSVFSMEATKAMQDKIRDAHQLGRFGRPVEIANAALFLASDEASFVTGVTLPVDGGYTAGHRFTG
jgi:NAD(P)-dependent dehydrogenase (short-subunit alcohol dehydrogenase family)